MKDPMNPMGFFLKLQHMLTVEEGNLYNVEIEQAQHDENDASQPYDVCLIIGEEASDERRRNAEGDENKRKTQDEAERMKEYPFSVLPGGCRNVAHRYPADIDEIGGDKGKYARGEER